MSRAPDRIDALPLLWAERRPDAPAFLDAGRAWTYRQLAESVATTAEALRGLGVGPGDRVMLVNENGLGVAALILAATRVDAWPVIVNARLSPREFEVIAAHCTPRRVLYTTEVSEAARAEAARSGAAPLEIDGLGRLHVGPPGESAPEPLPASPADRVAALIYTTGTTGAPKGVMLSHRNLLFVAAGGDPPRPLPPEDCLYCALPVSHIFGLASVFLRALYAGASVRLCPRFSAEEAAQTLAAGEVTVFPGVPAMFALLLEHAERTGARLASPRLRFISAGGAPLDPDLWRRVEAAFGLPLINGYGITECAATVSRSEPGDRASAGPPIPGMKLRIMGEDGVERGPGELGEIWLRGPNVMLGYYRNPAATAEVMTADGWYRTGDIGRLDPAGNLHVTDRARELIIRSGFNVYPVEVESVLLTHPAVTLAAVVGRPVDGPTGSNEEVVAFVQTAPGAEVGEEELCAHAAAGLAPYKRPARVVILDALPVAPTGKVLKAALKERAAALPARAPV